MNLLRSELRKLVYTRSFWALSLAAVAMVILSTAPTPYVLSQLQSNGFDPLSQTEIVDTVYGKALAGYLFVMIQGVLIMAGEFRHGTAVATFLTAPKRATVMLSKIVIASLVGVAVMIVSTAIGFLSAYFALSFYGDSAPPTSSVFVNTSIAAVVSGVVLSVIGVAIGTLVRNQMVAVTGTLIYLFVVERLITVFWQDGGKFLPSALITSMLAIDVKLDSKTVGVAIDTSKYLEPWPATALLVAYGVVFAGISIATSLRRDID
ncbi:MAG: ABC transporter permease [Micrococcales bacterium]